MRVACVPQTEQRPRMAQRPFERVTIRGRRRGRRSRQRTQNAVRSDCGVSRIIGFARTYGRFSLGRPRGLGSLGMES